MKCKKCGNSFPNTIWLDGKLRYLHHRRYCLSCSPFGEKNTINLAKQPNRGDTITTLCPSCNKEVKRISGKQHGKGLLCNTCVSVKQRSKRKAKAVEYKGGSCVYCGYNKCLQALDFHHRIPETKLFGISGNHCRSWDIVKAELDKCDLVCSNCHNEIHAGMKNTVVV